MLLSQAGNLVLKVSDPGVLLLDQPSPRIGGVRIAVCAVIPQFSHDLTLGNLGRQTLALQLKTKGVSHRVIARTLDISRSTLPRRLDELGLRWKIGATLLDRLRTCLLYFLQLRISTELSFTILLCPKEVGKAWTMLQRPLLSCSWLFCYWG